MAKTRKSAHPEEGGESAFNLRLPSRPAGLDDETISVSDLEALSDHAELRIDSSANGLDADRLVEVSIGQLQNRMKSPQISAEVKAVAMSEHAQDYFDVDLPSDDDTEAPDSGTSGEGETSRLDLPSRGDVTPQDLTIDSPEIPTSAASLRSPVEIQRQSRKENTATLAILGEGLATSRRRAVSVSSAVADSIKKLLPDLSTFPIVKGSSLSNLRFSNKSESESITGTSARSRRSYAPFQHKCLPLASSSLRNESRDTPKSVGQGLQGLQKNQHLAQESSQKVTSRTPDSSDGASRSPHTSRFSRNSQNSPSPTEALSPKILKRATSDTSLYLRQSASHASTLDDITNWDDVSGQVNSRFKAVKDSLHDSQLRLPKMPNINLASGFTSFRLPTAEKWDTGLADTRLNALDTVRDRSKSSPLNVCSDRPTSLDPNNDPRRDNRAHPLLAKALADLTGDVIVLGGYRGSILRSAKPPHRQFWIPVKVGLNLRKVDLEVGLDAENEEKMEDTIISSGVLSHIGPIDICRRLLRHLRKCPTSKNSKLRVHDYGYDWRLSPHLLSQRLIAFLEKLECNQPDTPAKGRGATVIAHSLGGLITRHAVNQRPDLFAGVVYAGVPQRCVNILGPLRTGDDVLLSSRVLTAQVNFTFRTSYLLLPEDGKCFINKRTGERYDIDFFKAKTWDEHRLSPCIKAPLPPVRPDLRKSLIGSLSNTLTALPTSAKRASESFLSTFTPERGDSAPLAGAKDGIKATAETAASEASKVTNLEANPPPPPLEPSMAQPYVGSSVATACTIPYDDAFAYLDRTLSSILAFKTELAFNPGHDSHNLYPPCAIMYSKTTPTVYGARVVGRDAIKHADAYDDLAFAAGDGVVLASAAMLPRGYKCVKGGKIETDRGHVGLLGDLEGVGKALSAILEARRRGVGLGNGRVR